MASGQATLRRVADALWTADIALSITMIDEQATTDDAAGWASIARAALTQALSGVDFPHARVLDALMEDVESATHWHRLDERRAEVRQRLDDALQLVAERLAEEFPLHAK